MTWLLDKGPFSHQHPFTDSYPQPTNGPIAGEWAYPSAKVQFSIFYSPSLQSYYWSSYHLQVDGRFVFSFLLKAFEETFQISTFFYRFEKNFPKYFDGTKYNWLIANKTWIRWPGNKSHYQLFQQKKLKLAECQFHKHLTDWSFLLGLVMSALFMRYLRQE